MPDPFAWLGDLVAYSLFGLSPDSAAGAALHFFVMDVAKLFALLVIVIYIMGLLRALVSPERVREFVRGRPDWQARGLAVGLGAVTPFCSCSSVPLFIGFVEAGIPLGVTFSFLIASPMINEVAAVLLIGILGWKLALLYIGAGLIVAWFGGIIMQHFKPERWVEDYVWKIHMGQAAAQRPDTSLSGRHRFAVAEVKEILRRIWKWVVIGIGVGALFHGFVPEQWVVDNLGNGQWLAVPGAVLVGIPLYSNATGVIPVAEAMLGKGVAVGTVLALMMSIAALSVPEMLILRKVIRWQALALFTGVLGVSFVHETDQGSRLRLPKLRDHRQGHQPGGGRSRYRDRAGKGHRYRDDHGLWSDVDARRGGRWRRRSLWRRARTRYSARLGSGK